VQGALRYDRVTSYAPVEGNGTFGKATFLNPQPITIVETPGVQAFNDISPRIGVAYDVFGTGRTALKLNWGRYLAYAANDSPYTATNPGATIVRNVQNRGWTDTNKNLVVDCSLLNTAANGECAAAVGTATNFGLAGAATAVDPAVLNGWGVRPNDYQTTVTLQHQIVPRVSADLSFTHRTFHGFFVTDDLARNAGTAYETYSLTAPNDPRLPIAGQPITFYTVKAAANVAAQTILRPETFFGRSATATGTASTSRSTPACGRASPCSSARRPAGPSSTPARRSRRITTSSAPRRTVRIRATAATSIRGRRRRAAW